MPKWAHKMKLPKNPKTKKPNPRLRKGLRHSGNDENATDFGGRKVEVE